VVGFGVPDIFQDQQKKHDLGNENNCRILKKKKKKKTVFIQFVEGDIWRKLFAASRKTEITSTRVQE